MAQRDETWVSRMAGGDEKAFEEFYNANARKVFAYLRSRGIDEQTASDILQNTFLAAWRSAARFHGGAKPLTWLIAIARHKLADEFRARERERASPPGTADGARDDTAQIDDSISLQQALQTLGDGHRELLHLVFVQGLSYAEAAEVLEVPEGTIKSRMFALKRQLAGRLTEGVGT